jgi:type II secretory pathway component PulJ
MARLRFPQLLSRPAATAQRGGAYTLVELLVGVALGSIVLGALGGALLVSTTKVSRTINTDLNSKDSLNRAVALMRDEISNAGIILTNYSVPTGQGNACQGSNQLYLRRAPNTVICYNSLAINSRSVTPAVPATGDRPWSGPCALVRNGPAYTANGDLDTSRQNITQVVLDRLVGCSPASAALALSVTGSGVSGSPISRDVDVTINQANGITTKFSARSASNPLNAGNDLYSSCSGSGAAVPLCSESPNERHFMPTMNTTGATCASTDCKPDKENIFYFKSPLSAYTLQSSSTSNDPCTRDSCYVLLNSTNASVQLNSNVDVLVFADQELRP